ncbi:MAG: GNAT family N-acetyltransferase [Planctomycetes bacterium]|nr:GNAT family N-acetyltransferase [Planctomycetota bacterium]
MDHLEHMRSHAVAYGASLSMDNMRRIESSILARRPLERVPKDYLVFAIEVDGSQVGDVVVAIRQGCPPELDVCVFDAYQGKGYAREAVRRALQELDVITRTELVATVRPGNPNRKRVESLLSACQFERVANGQWKYIGP